MPDVAIRVENISKRYKIGARVDRHATLRDQVAGAFAAPGRALARFARGEQASARPNNTEFWALNDVSFEVKQGEVVGVIGRNGAGKSTLLKILARITKPTRGRAEIYGRVGSLLEVGTGFHPELTGQENIYLNGAILGMHRDEIERKFDEIVAFAEVEKFIDTPVKRFSSGMYVRLAFAVAAHLETEILLVDEVLSVGDAAFQMKCLGKIGDVAREGRTVLFVSHTMAAIQQLCTRAILVRTSRLAGDGRPEQVINDYQSDANTNINAVFDYTQHPARTARYRPLIHKLTLRGSDGVARIQFFPNESMLIQLEIWPEVTIRAPRITVGIEDQVGRRIMTAASFLTAISIADISGPCHVQCTIPEINLGSGRYLVSVSVADKYSGLIDSVEGGAWFDVVWRNNYGNGEPFRAVYGPVLTASKWVKQDLA